VNHLNFDAENQVHPVSGLQYYYDGDGHRVAKSDGTRYWYDDVFNVLSTADVSNTLKRDYIYFNVERLGWVTISSGDPHYYLNDHIGSPRVIANGDGTVVSWESDYLPFGAGKLISNADNLSVSYSFTGYEYDPEMNPSGDYYADFRYQTPILGRFWQPDPIAGDPTDPQSLNRYAYVLNDPLDFTDPLGLGDPPPPPNCGTDTQCWNDWAKANYGRFYGGAPALGPRGQWDDPLAFLFIGVPGETGRIGTCASCVDAFFANLNIDTTWWKTFGSTFVDNLIHGMRKPGEFFSECVNRNVSDTTFGAVNPKKLFSQTLAKVEGAAIFFSTTNVPVRGPNGKVFVPLGPYLAGSLVRAMGMRGLSAVVAMRAAAAGMQGIAIAGAATLGTGIGSSINCR
jgi:RHS repeat-associated protein